MICRLWFRVLIITVVIVSVTFGVNRQNLKETKVKSKRVKIETSMGNIVIELNEAKAPVTVKNFLQYVKEGYYDGTIFHRVINGFMVQGGGFTADMERKKVHAPIINEASNGLKNDLGTVAMARTNDPDSATSQFFINHINNDFLNYRNQANPGYTVFGKVVEGMDIVNKIAAVKTTIVKGMQDVPAEPVVIKSAKQEGVSSESASNIKFKLAMGQMLVEPGKINENLKRAEKMIQDASRKDCKIIVLPECLDIGWTDSKIQELAEPVPGKTSDKLCQAAKNSGIYVVAGITERENDKIYNTAILISPEGKILLKHRKINVLNDAQDYYAIGDRLGVAETELGKIGINICADNFSDSLVHGHSLARMGANILLSPSAWMVKPDFDNEKTPYGSTWTKPYTTLAKLYDMTIVGVSNVGPMHGGPFKGNICIGNSIAVGPGGKILATGPFGVDAEALIEISVEIIPHKVKGTDISIMLKNKGYEGP